MNKIGLIPIEDYLDYLVYHKKFNKEMIIKYTNNIYDIDITPIDFDTYVETNIYKEFENEYTTSTIDDGSREWFRSSGRTKYINFLRNKINYETIEGYFLGLFEPKDLIHHIHPLEYSKNNGILNLIYISDFNHDILHMNPLENIEKYCYQAVDYLYYLYKNHQFYCNELKNIYNDIFIINKNKYSEEKIILATKELRVYIKNKMLEFYNHLLNDYEIAI